MNDKEEPISLYEEKTPDLFSVSEKARMVMESVGNAVVAYSEIIKNSSELCENISESISSALNAFVRISSFYSEAIKNSLNCFSSIITRLFDSVQIPELTEEEKNELKRSYEQWGKYGWTIIPDSPIGFFDDTPLSNEDANKKAEQYCKKADMELLFEEMRNKKIKKLDLEEAISCFKSRRYKACSLIIFGIIDSKLIRMMPKPENEKGKRPSGLRAAKKLEANFSEGQALSLYELLRFNNLISCLLTVFSDGNDFKEEPPVINRNFVDHGMSNRKVRRRDCVQLFLLLNNFVDVF